MAIGSESLGLELDRVTCFARAGQPTSRVPPPIIDDVMRSALTGEWLPFSVLAQLLERLRAGRDRSPRRERRC